MLSNATIGPCQEISHSSVLLQENLFISNSATPTSNFIPATRLRGRGVCSDSGATSATAAAATALHAAQEEDHQPTTTSLLLLLG